MKRLLLPLPIVVALLWSACSTQSASPPAAHRHAPSADKAPPPLYTDLGTYQRKITTASPQAQAYFDQGLRLVYSFKTQDMLLLAAEALAGEVAVRGGDGPTAARHFAQAVKIQDGHSFTEPPPWYYPVRQSLGAALMAAGRPAEAVYREDLKQNRENGWSLFALAQSLQAQGKTAEADPVQARFNLAWARADVTLTASRF